jgi:hypothetical protein
MVLGERFPKLEHAVAIATSQTFHVPAALDMQQGREAVDRAIKGSVLRPFDVASNTHVHDVAPLWIPFWRVALAVEGIHVNIENVGVGSKGRTVPMPTGARYKDAVVMVCARTTFPYPPRLPSLFDRTAGVRPLEVGTKELVAISSLDELLANDAEVVDADITRDRAESLVLELLLREASPSHAIYEKIEPRIEDLTFCLYPIYYARYSYSGEARRHPDEQFFVAVSGKTGEVVSATYPSAARSVAAKVRRFLSFDRRGG